MFRKIYVYAHTSRHVITMNKKDIIDLKNSQKGYIGRFKGKNRGSNVVNIIISKVKESRKNLK